MALNFRKRSLEKLSSPEQLDAMIQITNRSGWIALLTVGFCLVVALIWGLYGQVPTKLSGYGLLLNPQGLFQVKASSSGQLEELNVERNDTVHKGDVLPVIDHPAKQVAVKEPRDLLQELEDSYQQLKSDNRENLSRKKQELEKKTAGLQQSIRIKTAKLARLRERLENQKELLKLGLITKYELTRTQEEIEQTQMAITKNRNQILILKNDYALAKRQSREQLMDLEKKLDQARDDLDLKTARLREASLIESPYTGRVVGLGAIEGTRVNPGDELMTLELTAKTDNPTLQVLQYYPAATAKKIKEGMTTHIAPGTVNVDQYGYLLAEVTHVSEFPETSAELNSKLQNDQLVSQIERMGAVLEVESRIVQDSSTPSGYAWTSSQGPPFSLEVGTPCTSSVIVEQTPPITLVVPILKKYLLGTREARS